jgi:hypothetical protein
MAATRMKRCPTGPRGAGGWLGLVAVVLLAALGLQMNRVEAATAHAPRNVSWHGGPVQRHPRVYLIFWGPKWARSSAHKRIRADLVKTLRTIRGSSYQKILTQYYDRQGHVTEDVRLAGVWHDPSTPSGNLSGSNRGVYDAAKEIAHAVAVNHWHNALDAQYMLLLQNPQANGYCANDVNESFAGSDYIFTVFPWLSRNGSECGGPPLDEGFESTFAHEYAEMVTDPLANAWARGNPAGHNNEIADICPLNAKLRGVWVEEIWSNELHRCSF